MSGTLDDRYRRTGFSIGCADTVSYTHLSIDEFSVSFKSSNANITDRYYVKGEKRGYYGDDLLKHALHNTVPDITKTVQDKEGNDIKVRDAEAIQLADTKINEIRSCLLYTSRY